MKKLFLKTMAISLLLLAMPKIHQGQQPRFVQNESTIDFNINDIALFDERVFFIYNLVNDSRFNVVTSEEDGVFIVSADPSFEGMDLKAAFADFRAQNNVEFSRMDKEQASETAMEYKSLLSQEVIQSLMMEVYIKSRQNNLCANADPFCTDNGLYEFPAGVNAGNGESGPSYNCLSTTPNPAWYYMRIGTPGNINIYMYSTPSKDIDFCCWGPFDDPVAPCPNGLTSAKVVSCSYSSSATETCVIPSSAQTGKYYILVITNYSNAACNITFSKTSGTGTTDCGIMPPLVENGGPYCVGQTITLSGNAQAGATYSWSGPDGWTATGANVTRPNCTMGMNGTYTCTIHVGSQSNSATTEVSVFANPTANFTASSACLGQPVQFTSTSTTNPSGQAITSYLWDFGDGQTSTQQNPTHQYNTAGNHNVSLTVSCGGSCSNTKQQTITTYAIPTANFTATTACFGQATQFTNSSTNTANQAMTYHWDFGDGQTSTQTNPSHQYTTVGNHTVTLTASCGGTCSDTKQQTVVTNAAPVANFTATSVCFGEATQFTSTSTTNPSGQTITSYLWNFGGGHTSTAANPTYQFTSPGNHNVSLTVSCGGNCSDTKQQTVSVYANPVANAGPDQTIAYGGVASLNGSGGTGTFNYHWEPADKVVNPNAQNTQTVVLTANQNFTLTVTNRDHPECTSSDQVTIHISGSSMTASASVSPSSICLGEETAQLLANAGGGTGNFTYSWTPTTGLSNPNIYNPVASPTQTTTYTCHVSDGQTSQDVSATVTVNMPETAEETAYICPDDIYNFHGQLIQDVGEYTFDTLTAQGCTKTITLHLRHHPTFDETSYTEFICPGETYNFFGTPYNHDCQVSHTLSSIHGCDSIIRLNLIVYQPNDTTIIDPTICLSQTYNFHGTEYSQDGDVAYFDTIDSHGCLKVEKLELHVGEYQVPPKEEPRICVPYDETPFYVWSRTGDTLTEDTYKEIILPDPNGGCDIKYRLNLKFHQEFYQEYTVTECDEYTWGITGLKYTSSDQNIVCSSSLGGGSEFNCDSTYVLHLTINHSDHSGVTEEHGHCDSVYWALTGLSYYNNGDYPFDLPTSHGCDSTNTLHVRDMKYTPNPSPITCSDASAVVYGDTIAVITATEFLSFVYSFQVIEQGTAQGNTSVWDSCEWKISSPQGCTWDIDEFASPGETLNRNCRVNVGRRYNEPVVLTCRIKNECGETTKNFYLKSSYYDVDDIADAANVTVIPNPNNGTMWINLDGMEGQVRIKVFDMAGTKIDDFETQAESNLNKFEYRMKTRAESGLFLFVFSDNNKTMTKKVVLIR